jgi:ABC-type molybdate transport system permease subunit
VWFPGLRHALNVTDDSLAWAAGIPELATTIVLAHARAQAARAAGDREAQRWLQTARALLVVVLVLPPVVLGGGLDPLVGALAVVGSVSLLLVIVLLFRYAGRPWALPTQDEAVRRG